MLFELPPPLFEHIFYLILRTAGKEDLSNFLLANKEMRDRCMTLIRRPLIAFNEQEAINISQTLDMNKCQLISVKEETSTYNAMLVPRIIDIFPNIESSFLINFTGQYQSLFRGYRSKESGLFNRPAINHRGPNANDKIMLSLDLLSKLSTVDQYTIMYETIFQEQPQAFAYRFIKDNHLELILPELVFTHYYFYKNFIHRLNEDDIELISADFHNYLCALQLEISNEIRDIFQLNEVELLKINLDIICSKMNKVKDQHRIRLWLIYLENNPDFRQRVLTKFIQMRSSVNDPSPDLTPLEATRKVSFITSPTFLMTLCLAQYLNYNILSPQKKNIDSLTDYLDKLPENIASITVIGLFENYSRIKRYDVFLPYVTDNHLKLLTNALHPVDLFNYIRINRSHIVDDYCKQTATQLINYLPSNSCNAFKKLWQHTNNYFSSEQKRSLLLKFINEAVAIAIIKEVFQTIKKEASTEIDESVFKILAPDFNGSLKKTKAWDNLKLAITKYYLEKLLNLHKNDQVGLVNNKPFIQLLEAYAADTSAPRLKEAAYKIIKLHGYDPQLLILHSQNNEITCFLEDNEPQNTENIYCTPSGFFVKQMTQQKGSVEDAENANNKLIENHDSVLKKRPHPESNTSENKNPAIDPVGHFGFFTNQEKQQAISNESDDEDEYYANYKKQKPSE